MQRTPVFTIGVFTLSLLTSLPAFAVIPSALPPEQTQGSMAYRTGGFEQDEARAFEAAEK